MDQVNEESRKSEISKMKQILESGSNIMLFLEGSYNNTENQLVTLLFSSPWLLSSSLEIEVVPFITFYDFGSNEIWIRAGVRAI